MDAFSILANLVAQNEDADRRTIQGFITMIEKEPLVHAPGRPGVVAYEVAEALDRLIDALELNAARRRLRREAQDDTLEIDPSTVVKRSYLRCRRESKSSLRSPPQKQ